MVKKCICQVCGAEFEAVGRNAKFCSECKKSRQRKQRSESNRKYYMKKNFGADVAKNYEAAKKSQEPLKEIVRQADAAGMSYGQYVQRKEEENMKEEPKTAKPDTVRLLIAKAADALKRSEVDCKEIGEAYGLLTAAQMILEGEA